ncbi:MAG: hypothetical protein H7228_06630 [Polaromonas sp.]|nr:hypothetical protein [Polaromonas sp.]
MKAFLRTVLAVCTLAVAGHSMAQVTFYQNENYQGQTFTAEGQVGDLQRFGFNDRASSAVVQGGSWEVCDSVNFTGRCVIMLPGNYPSLNGTGLNDRVTSVRVANPNARVEDNRYAPAAVAGAPSAETGQVVLYAGESFQGQSFTAQNQVEDFTRYGFNDRATSAVVLGDRWEACENVRFGGRCVVLRPGRYPSLTEMGMSGRISSVRAVAYDARVSDDRYAPLPVAAYDNRRRGGERLYEIPVSSVRAVVATPEQRCWMEPGVAAAPVRGGPNIGGAIAGALIGGILGHQVGGGTGKDLATIGGLAAGAAVGANVGRNNAGQPVATPDVQRCEPQAAQTKPTYWDVTYNFRGQEHRVQMTSAPGPTITVNGQGEPRT